MFFIIPLSYAVLWLVLLLLTGFSKSKYLATKTQRNNFIVVLHAFIVPSLIVGYFLINPKFFHYESLTDTPIKHLYSLSVGYYIFSIINLYITEKKPEKAMVNHHLFFATIFLFAANTPSLPGFLALTKVPQCTGFVYHIYLILKETPGENRARVQFWHDLNFYTWITFRFLINGVITVFAVYYEFTQLRLSIQNQFFVMSFILISYSFNIHWLVIILKVRKKKAERKALLYLRNIQKTR